MNYDSDSKVSLPPNY